MAADTRDAAKTSCVSEKTPGPQAASVAGSVKPTAYDTDAFDTGRTLPGSTSTAAVPVAVPSKSTAPVKDVEAD